MLHLYLIFKQHVLHHILYSLKKKRAGALRIHYNCQLCIVRVRLVEKPQNLVRLRQIDLIVNKNGPFLPDSEDAPLPHFLHQKRPLENN